MIKKIFWWIIRLAPAIILLQTLPYKFSDIIGFEGSLYFAQTQYIFGTVGLEPWGRYITASIELVCAVLILIPSTAWLGAIGGVGVMCGAIFFHLTLLGIEIPRQLSEDGTLNTSGLTDGGSLFFLAFVVLITCLIILFLQKDKIIDAVKSLR